LRTPENGSLEPHKLKSMLMSIDGRELDLNLEEVAKCRNSLFILFYAEYYGWVHDAMTRSVYHEDYDYQLTGALPNR